MKKGEMSIETLVKVVLGALVLVVVLVGVSYGYNSIMKPLKNQEWGTLSLTEQTKITSNFENTVSLLKSCSGKFNCLCGKENGFPAAFKDEETLTINNTGKDKAILILKHLNQEIARAEINQNIFLNTAPLINANPILIVSFDDLEYLINEEKSASSKQAFMSTGDAFYLFNKDFDKNHALYKSYASMNKTC